jgi:hypothetical protein
MRIHLIQVGIGMIVTPQLQVPSAARTIRPEAIPPVPEITAAVPTPAPEAAIITAAEAAARELLADLL